MGSDQQLVTGMETYGAFRWLRSAQSGLAPGPQFSSSDGHDLVVLVVLASPMVFFGILHDFITPETRQAPCCRSYGASARLRAPLGMVMTDIGWLIGLTTTKILWEILWERFPLTHFETKKAMLALPSYIRNVFSCHQMMRSNTWRWCSHCQVSSQEIPIGFMIICRQKIGIKWTCILCPFKYFFKTKIK